MFRSIAFVAAAFIFFGFGLCSADCGIDYAQVISEKGWKLYAKNSVHLYEYHTCFTITELEFCGDHVLPDRLWAEFSVLGGDTVPFTLERVVSVPQEIWYCGIVYPAHIISVLDGAKVYKGAVALQFRMKTASFMGAVKLSVGYADNIVKYEMTSRKTPSGGSIAIITEHVEGIGFAKYKELIFSANGTPVGGVFLDKSTGDESSSIEVLNGGSEISNANKGSEGSHTNLVGIVPEIGTESIAKENNGTDTEAESIAKENNGTDTEAESIAKENNGTDTEAESIAKENNGTDTEAESIAKENNGTDTEAESIAKENNGTENPESTTPLESETQESTVASEESSRAGTAFRNIGLVGVISAVLSVIL